MSDTTTLDILVVYSSSKATSASVSDAKSMLPFMNASLDTDCNRSYSYFLDFCKTKNLSAGFTTSSDIIGPGKCGNFWTSSDGVWTKNDRKAKAIQIFDKISPTSPTRLLERTLLLSNDKIKPFNNVDLHATFYDKLRSYQKLPEFAIPTVAISKKGSGVKASVAKLNKLVATHNHATDFGTDFILKDRFGAGGEYVYKITGSVVETIEKHVLENPKITFVLQPFLAFDAGFAYKENETATDIRMIFQHNKILQIYLRMAKEGDFRCNEHQGGQVVYVSEKDLPASVRRASKNILKKIDLPKSLFALDFAVSNSGRAYLMEGNIGPGLNWDPNKYLSEKMSKQLIQSIVNEIASRIMG